MKTYLGRRTENGCNVIVKIDSSKRKLRHIPFHSPSGFNWGYEGSGAADLAFAILVDLLKERPPAKGWQAARLFDRFTVKSKAWKYHQDFKRAFVAKWRTDSWMVYAQTIQEWITKQEQT